MTFEKYAPDPQLRPWVESILIVRSPEGMVNTLAPNSAPVLTFRLEGTTTELRSGEKPIPRLAVTGLIHSPRTIRYHPRSAMLLVRFREGVASGLAAPGPPGRRDHKPDPPGPGQPPDGRPGPRPADQP